MIFELAAFIAVAGSAEKDPGWEFRQYTEEGAPICVLARNMPDDTALFFMASRKLRQDDRFLFGAANPNWSIEQDKDLGEIVLQAKDYYVGSRAFGDGGGFSLAVGYIALENFLNAASSAGFEIRRNGSKSVGTYDARGLASALPSFKACLRKNVEVSDPFAD